MGKGGKRKEMIINMNDVDLKKLPKDQLIECLTWTLSGYKLSKLRENKGFYDIKRIEKNIQTISAHLQKRYPFDHEIIGIILTLIPKEFKEIIRCPECYGRIDIVKFQKEGLKEFYGSENMYYCHHCSTGWRGDELQRDKDHMENSPVI